MTAHRLLFVDDSGVICLTMAALLEDEGYEVDTAASYEEAFARLETDSYQAVVLDLNLAGRNGADLVPVVRARSPAAKIVISSGTDASEIGDLPPVDAVVGKVVAAEKLIPCLRDLLA
jgi:two-component system, response regulator RegA